MAVVVHAAALPMAGRPAWAVLFVQIGAGAASYWVMVHSLELPAYLELASFLRARGGSA